MNRSLRLPIAVPVICTFAGLSCRSVCAQIGISNGQAAGITVAIGAIAVGIGVALYLTFRTPPTIIGCAVAGAIGVMLQNEGDRQTSLLTGETAIKAGDRIKVKRKKKSPAGNHPFLVSDLMKDYGAHTNLPPTPSPPHRR